MSSIDPAAGPAAAGPMSGTAAMSGTAPATAEWYRHFGTADAPGNSACYAEWAVGIAEDAELIRRIEEWPYNKRQPLLMFAAARYLGAQISPYRDFRNFLQGMRRRRIIGICLISIALEGVVPAFRNQKSPPVHPTDGMYSCPALGAGRRNAHA